MEWVYLLTRASYAGFGLMLALDLGMRFGDNDLWSPFPYLTRAQKMAFIRSLYTHYVMGKGEAMVMYSLS